MTPAEHHRQVAADFARRVDGAQDWDAPAPVDGWTARDVVGHLVEWFPGFLEAGTGIRLPAGPQVADDPVAAWHQHAAAVQDLLDDPATAGRVLSDPHIGDVPLPEAVERFYTADVFMHTWDLARATGQDETLDAATCAELLAGMEPMDDVLRASGQYGPRVEVPADADVQTRLLGFIGRDPAGAARRLTPMKVLVTGGAGYIGSITAKALEDAGHTPVVLDSLLTGPKAFVRDRAFYEGDVGDRALLRRIVDENPDLDATIHMAARIVVPESVEKPYEYYRDNVATSLELFDELSALGKNRVIFSSSASLYALKDDFEVTEADPLAPSSPYARTKRMMEEVLEDLAVATDLRAIILRYFNPIGSDPDLESGIYAREPSHVLGQLVMAARGQKDAFTITGTDLPTRDGTGIRDYIHVWDLARAHVRAVERFDEVITAAGTPSIVINLGAGEGVTVRELITAFQNVFGHEVPLREASPRPGDAVGAFANVDRARELLDWRTELSLEEAIASALAWGEKRREILGYE